MANENYEFKHFNQDARFDVYRQARPMIYRALKEFIRVWGVNVEIFQQTQMGINGHQDASRAEFDFKNPIYYGSAFIPSVIQSSVGRGRTAILDIFERKTPRIFFDKDVELPYGALCVVKDMDRLRNFLIDEKQEAYAPNSHSVYTIYKLVPFNVADKRANQDELEAISDKYELSIDEFEVPNDYDNTDDVGNRPTRYKNSSKHAYTNLNTTDNSNDINS